MKTKGHMDLLKAITERIDNEFMRPKKNIIRVEDWPRIFTENWYTMLKCDVFSAVCLNFGIFNAIWAECQGF